MRRLALFVLLAACARDLTLPGAGQASTVAGFSPASGFAGATITVRGQGFDPVAARNSVHFGAVTQQADAVDAQGNLIVRVPDDAQSGPLAVSTVAGLGTASADKFTYEGVGHLRDGRLSTTVEILHHTPGIAAAQGDIWIASQLFRFVQDRMGRIVHVAHRPNALVAAPDGSALYVSEDDTVEHLVVRIDPPTATGGTPVVVPFFPRALATAMSGGKPVLFVAGEDSGVAYVESYTADTSMAVLAGQRELPLATVMGIAATADGGVVAIAGQRHTTIGGAAVLQAGVLVVDMADPLSTPTFVVPPGTSTPTGAIALAGSRMAVGFDDGTIGDLGLFPSPVWSAQPYDTLSRSPVGGLASFQSGAMLLASKPAELSAVAIDVASKHVVWGVPVRGSPVQVAADPSDGTVYAAEDTANFVNAIDGSTGAWLNRISFEAQLGNADGAACGAAFDRAPTDGSNPRFLVIARNAAALLNLEATSLQAKKPIGLIRGASAPVCVGVSPDGHIWVLHTSEIGLVDVQGKKETIISDHLPVPPRNIAFLSDSRAVISFDGEAAVMAPDGTVQGGVVFDGALDMVTPRGGSVTASWSTVGARPAVPHVATWTEAAFVAGGDPVARYDDESPNLGYDGSVSLPGRTLVIYDQSMTFASGSAIPLDAALHAQPEEAAPVRTVGPITNSPDGRYFLWTRLRAPDLILHMTRAIAGQPILHVADLPMAGPLQGAVFDAFGERLLVPVSGSDTIQVFE